MQPFPDEHGDLSERLLRAYAVIGRAAKSTPVGGLDRGAGWLLLVLDHNGAMRLSHLATHCGLDGSTVSRHVKRLEDDGLVARTPDPDDGRAQLIELSAEGRATVHRTRQQRRALIADRLADWSADDLATLTSLTSRLADQITTTLQNEPRNRP